MESLFIGKPNKNTFPTILPNKTGSVLAAFSHVKRKVRNFMKNRKKKVEKSG